MVQNIVLLVLQEGKGLIRVNKSAMAAMQNIQDNGHWWYEGRYAVIQHIIMSLHLPKDTQILEIGCGYGSNLHILANFGKVEALEINDEAREYAHNISGIDVYKGWLPDGLESVKGRHFDLICLLDVLEHVKDDNAALRNIRNYIKEEGKFLLIVPAYQWMWSKHDEKNSHFRRYSKQELRGQLQDAGYTIDYIGYMLTFLFPLMLLARLFDRFSKDADSGMSVPPYFLNSFLSWVFSAERFLIPRFSLPFGGSVVAVCRRKKLSLEK